MNAHMDAQADKNDPIDRPVTPPQESIKERYLEQLMTIIGLLAVKENTACIAL